MYRSREWLYERIRRGDPADPTVSAPVYDSGRGPVSALHRDGRITVRRANEVPVLGGRQFAARHIRPTRRYTCHDILEILLVRPGAIAGPPFWRRPGPRAASPPLVRRSVRRRRPRPVDMRAPGC
ncbi:hypothetical protein TNCT6_75220 [Streptomyces sp. 6-11-2]|nr:hypothetical protein TNCT6_75220 [Streptomyces sp. 6-11-2]